MGIICCVSCAGCCQPPHTGLGDCWPGPADALYFLDRITEYPEVDGALMDHQISSLFGQNGDTGLKGGGPSIKLRTLQPGFKLHKSK